MNEYEKKYKDALERARQFSEHPLCEDSSNIVEYIFPELQESEDEKISREITEFIVNFHNGNYEKPYDYTIGTWVAWLEKQKSIEWNDEDEQYLLVCKNALYKYEYTDKWDANIIISWLVNKLKQRMEE